VEKRANATADVVDYVGTPMVKVGREFLLRRYGARKKEGQIGGR
jgi:nicotinate phosphoribosyltransferase